MIIDNPIDEQTYPQQINGVAMSSNISGITEQRIEKEEIAQIFNDESLRLCQYKDSLGNATIGVGHLVLEREKLPKCISSHEAISLLIKDYRYAKHNVEKT